MEDQNDKPPPSLDLAFDWVKGVLYAQTETADALDTKAATFFSIATLVLGVGISLTFSQAGSVPVSVLALSVVAVALYMKLAWFAIQALRPRKYKKLDNPTEIRKYYWDLEPDGFKIQLLTHMEGAYEWNESVLKRKASDVRKLPWLVGLQVVMQAVSMVLLAVCGG